jgi:integrase
MASIKLFPDSALFYACFKLPTGQKRPDGTPIYRRVQRTTGTADRSKALQIALSLEQASVLAAEGKWQDKSAGRFLAELSALTGTTMASREPLNAFLTRWLQMRVASLKPDSVIRYDGILTAFLGHMGALAGCAISEVTPAQVAAFRDAQAAAGISATTINKSLMVLGQAFDEAHRQGLVERNPARGLNVKGAAKQKQHRRAFTFDQFRALYAALGEDRGWMRNPLRLEWQTFVALAGYTGGRQQEIAHLTWEQIDLKRGVLTLARGKTSDTHWIPLHTALRAHLERTHPDGRYGPVMPLLAARQRRHISNDFRRLILPRIGVDQPFAAHKTGNKGRRLAEYSIHSLRHSLATWLAAAGIEEAMRMRLIGHEDATVNRGYTHANAEQAAKALEAVPNLTP